MHKYYIVDTWEHICKMAFRSDVFLFSVKPRRDARQASRASFSVFLSLQPSLSMFPLVQLRQNTRLRVRYRSLLGSSNLENYSCKKFVIYVFGRACLPDTREAFFRHQWIGTSHSYKLAHLCTNLLSIEQSWFGLIWTMLHMWTRKCDLRGGPTRGRPFFKCRLTKHV